MERRSWKPELNEGGHLKLRYKTAFRLAEVCLLGDGMEDLIMEE